MCPEVCRLLSYWYSLCQGKEVPQRSQVDLRELTNILPWMFILEMTSDGAIKFRLAGSSLESAVGRGMAGKFYSGIFAEIEQGAAMEEIYASALVQSCGVLRIGRLKIDEDTSFDMEVIALPFIEDRAMGGTIMVGVMKPFDVNNQEFEDKWGTFTQTLQQLLIIPSPRIVTGEHLSARVSAYLSKNNINIRAMDLNKFAEIDKLGQHQLYQTIPSVDLSRMSFATRNH